MRCLLVLILSMLSTASMGQYRHLPSPPALCETAIVTAEYIGRVPPRLLSAIAVTESGRLDAETATIRPWPWTINAEGAGQFFATKTDAIAAVRALQARGIQSIDVGCMQINLFHHPAAFTSLDEAFDPHANARYAARFLNVLYASSGDWSHAIGSYHSETPALGEAYRTLVIARWQRPDLTGGSAGVAYRSFAPVQQSYGAFAPADRVYGAFTHSPPTPAPARR